MNFTASYVHERELSSGLVVELLLQVGRGWSGLVSMELRTVGLPVAA